MASPTLLVRLSNEAKQSPGKAGLLVAGLALAIYMWAPLVFGWIGKSSATASNPVSKSEAEVLSQEIPTTSDVKGQLYQQFNELEAAEILQPWTPDSSPVVLDQSVAEESESYGKQHPGDLAKFELSGVLVGGRTGNMANLNGQVVRQGETVWMDFQSDQPELTFKAPAEPGKGRWLKVFIRNIQQDQMEVQIENQTLIVPVRSNRSFAPTQ